MTYFIVEHPTRGLLGEDSEIDQPQWLTGANRGDERVMRAYSFKGACDMLMKYSGSRAVGQAYVLRAPNRDRGEVEWKRVA